MNTDKCELCKNYEHSHAGNICMVMDKFKMEEIYKLADEGSTENCPHYEGMLEG